jgi:hypothetical protein
MMPYVEEGQSCQTGREVKATQDRCQRCSDIQG